MDIFVCGRATRVANRGVLVLLVAVRRGVVRRAALLESRAGLLIVVVVLFAAQHQLVGLAEERRGAPAGPANLAVCVATLQQVRGLPDCGDHLLGRLDRVVRRVVLHRHFEVRVHHPCVQVVAPTHVDRPTRVERSEHAVDAGFGAAGPI